ncbi:MAG: DsbA family protein [Chloroflexi bacterium]|nr:DsbA family protein [Chloroflexota bacterium]
MAELQARHDVEVSWLPFELRPEPAPLPDMSGPDGERYRTSWQRGVAPLAAQFGVEMHFNPIKPRSRLAHETAELARIEGKFDAMRQTIFRAYFVQGKDIGDPEELVRLALETGLELESVRSTLANGDLTPRVQELETIALRWGIQAVPTMVIGRYAVQGVRPYETLRDVLARVESEATSEPTAEI